MPFSQKVEKKSFLILLLLLMVAGIYVLYPFLNTIILSGALTVMFYPLHRKFLKWTKKKQGLSAFLSVSSVILFILAPIAFLITLVTSQVFSVLNSFSLHITKPQFSTMLAQWHDSAMTYIAKLEQMSGYNFQIVPAVENTLRGMAQLVAQYSPSLVTGTATVAFHFFIMVIVLYYLFKDGDEFFKKLIRISPIKDRYELKLAQQIQKTIYGVFYGSFLTSLVQAVLACLGFYVAGVEGPVVWAMITFFVSFIPLIGTATVLVPMVIYKVIEGNMGAALFLGVYSIVVIGMSDNVLKPLLIKSDMHPLVLFLSLFGGIAVFGPEGFLLGPILMALLTATLKIYDQDFAGAL